MPALPAIGVDIVECERIRAILARQGDAFLKKVFTPGESSYCLRMMDPAPSLAARFAAKEALAKALGTGIGAQAGMLDIEVVKLESGAPAICLHGDAARTAAAMGVGEVRVSLSHTGDQAVAMVMLLPSAFHPSADAMVPGGGG